MNIRKAERRQAKIKMALQGPSGAGKTYSALLLAYGITEDWSKVVVIDTENNSSDLYAHLGDFNVYPLSKPFSPERYVEAIKACEKANMQVIIIDSISHEWEGQGGILNIHGGMAGNSFTNWSKVTPRHNAFVNAILQSPCHIIGTIRTKQDYVLSDKNGKLVPEKVGLKGVTRDGMDYEFTLVFDLDIKHNAKASKDRTALFADKPEIVLTPDTGRKIMEWCQSGLKAEDVKDLIRKCPEKDGLYDLYNRFPEFQEVLLEDFQARKMALDGSNVHTAKLRQNGIDSIGK